MSSEIYFNNQKVLSAITSYNELSNASKPTIESVILEGNRTARELNLMSRNEITQLIAQSRIPAVLPNYPATPVTGVVYYIGTSAPYNVCLYAVNDVGALERVDLGTTNIDISSKQDKVDNSLLTTSKNIVGAINENKTNIDLKQNKIDDSLITTNKNIVSAINEIYNGKVNNFVYDSYKTRQELLEASAVGCNSFNVSFTNAESPVGSTSARFIVFVNKNNLSRCAMTAQQINVTGDTQGDIWTCFLNGSGWSNWQFALQNKYAPIQSSVSLNNFTKEADDAVWNLTDRTPTEAYRRYIEKRTIFAAVVDPITNVKIYGDMEVTISCYLAGSDNGTIIKQVIDCNYSSQDVRKVFMRIGTLNKSYGVAVEDNKDKIVWKDWIPIEYPRTNLSLESGFTTNGGDCYYDITGGNMFVHFNCTWSGTSGATYIAICFLPVLPYKVRGGAVTYGTLTQRDTGYALESYFSTQDIHNYTYRIRKMPSNSVSVQGSIMLPLGY